MNTFAILLYCQGVHIVLPKMNMAHIVFIAKNPTYWQCDNTANIFHVTSLLNCFCTNFVAKSTEIDDSLSL
ncbi:Uncharacterized protein HZ326_30548 [Fusarium oxysporum f. sp. albedinis]|nr:Uncharacterized protein HZ326_30548 [Fusarium oxysporum f. sp. albedinis]